LKFLFRYPALLLLSICLLPWSISQAQEADSLSLRQKWVIRKSQRIEEGRTWISPLAGPAYTPELKFTLAGGILISYKTRRTDSLIQRSSSPILFGLSTSGAFIFQSKNSTYWLGDKLRINADFWFKDMPDHYWGTGYLKGLNTLKSDSTTVYHRLWWMINPIFLWQFRHNMFLGINVDYNYTRVKEPSAGVANDPEYQKYGFENLNSGFGLCLRYDSRDIPVNAWSGTYFDLSSTFYRSEFGGRNNYTILKLDIRHYFPVFTKVPGKIFALQFMTRAGWGNVPYAELSQLGSPFDLRGYLWGHYRDQSVVYFIAEYRHMFSNSSCETGRHGLVVWLGTGSVSDDLIRYIYWLPNAGAGYRFELQPRMNLRIDIGFGKKSRGFYLNFNEAF